MNHHGATDRTTALRPHRPHARLAGVIIAPALCALTACSGGGVVVVTITPSASGPSSFMTSPTATDATPPTGPAPALSPTGQGISPGTGDIADAGDTGDIADTSTTAAPTTPAPQPVHVATFEGDGDTFGIGMAVMALFTVAPTDAAAFEQAATVTVNGEPADGAWFWQASTVPGYAAEALYREKDYWPAHATIAVDLPVKGLSAGDGLAYDDSLTVTFSIGAAHISHVSNKQHRMTVTSDDEVVKNLPISLGAADTPTFDGTKVVMAKENPAEMKSDPGDPHPYDLEVPYSVRVTNSGEFIHAASWNTGNIGSRNTSHGCTNLDLADAKWFYKFSLLGDVVDYPDANPAGTAQPSWDGWGWWNVPWSQWTAGGTLPTA